MPTARFSFLARWSARLKLLLRRRPPDAAETAAAADRDLVMRLAPARIPSPRQFRHLSSILSAQEQRVTQVATSLAMLSLLVLSGHAVLRHLATVPRAGGTLTEALVGTPQFLNPVLARPFTVDADLSRLTFRGLMKVDERLRLVPDLAASVTAGGDGKSYTVTLPKNLRWSDGQPLTSDDIRYTFETIADPAYQSPWQTLYQGLAIATPDDRTAIFTLKDAFAPFISYLTIGLLPAHVWQDANPQSFALAELNAKPVGNGPYRFQSLTKDRAGNIRSYTFIRNKNANQQPYLDKVVIKLYPDQAAALDALATGAVDALGNISPADRAKVTKHHRLTPFALSQLTAVFFSQRTNPALRAKAVRQALALATDKTAIVAQALDGAGQAIDGPLLPGQEGYNPDLKRYEFNLDRAKALLDQSGWKTTTAGVRQKGSQQLTFVLTTVKDPVYEAVAKQLVSGWREIGATVELKTVSSDQMQKEVIRPRKYEALLFGQLYDADADPYPLWHSSQQKSTGFNLALSFLKGVDKDLEDARTTTDAAKRTKDLFDFQNIVAEEVPAIFLYQAEYLYAHPKTLRGFPTDRLVSATDRFDGLNRWYLRTGLQWR